MPVSLFHTITVLGYDMSHAIRRYSHYLSQKAFIYRTMGYDFCRIPRGYVDLIAIPRIALLSNCPRPSVIVLKLCHE